MPYPPNDLQPRHIPEWDPYGATMPSGPPAQPGYWDSPTPQQPPAPPRPPIGWTMPAATSGAPAAPPRRSAGAWVAGLIVVLLLALAVGSVVAIGTRALVSPARPSTASGQGRVGAAPAPSTPSQPQPSTGSGSGSNSGSGSGSGSGSAPSSWAEVASAVNPGIVNIESRLPAGIGAGTGMVITDTGEILTNNHVVEDASQIAVTLVSTGDTYRAQVVGTDPHNDVAVLQLQSASGLSTIPLGDSDAVQVGDSIAALGNAGGQGGEPVVATGKVVALHRTITASDPNGTNAERLTDMIQVDANVVSGDSGGPLANDEGKVVGMNSAASAEGTQGRSRGRTTTAHEGYAIPINKALAIADQLDGDNASPGTSSGGNQSGGSQSGGSQSGGRQPTSQGYLGVQARTSTSGGAVVTGVQADSPAQQAGLRSGDTIVAIDDTAVDDADQLTTTLHDHSAGDEITVTWRTSTGRQRQATVTLATR